MMRHFEVMTWLGERWLMELDMTRYNFWFGFRRVVRKL